MNSLRLYIGLLVVLAVPAVASAKGITTRIVITGPDLTTTIEITDPEVLKEFLVWAGPGVWAYGAAQKEGFIIDWPTGVVADPAGGLPRYRLSFYVGDDRRPVQERGHQLAYVVLYTYDPAAARGYIYLPGSTDEDHRLNTRSISRGRDLEGHWFRATSAWQRVVTPLIAQPGQL